MLIFALITVGIAVGYLISVVNSPVKPHSTKPKDSLVQDIRKSSLSVSIKEKLLADLGVRP